MTTVTREDNDPSAEVRIVGSDGKTPGLPGGQNAPTGATHSARSGRMRYARVSDLDVWLEVPPTGFVGAIIDSMVDGRERVVLAWPSRPDNGFVAAALALREVRAAGKRTHGTLAIWPWRRAATHAARSILVNAEDICLTARREFGNVGKRAPATDPKLAYLSLCMVELRLNDLIRGAGSSGRTRSNDIPGGGEGPTTRNPTLLETTAVFEPVESPTATAFQPDVDQVLRRVRRHTSLATIPMHVANVGDPLVTPFALMGLKTDRDSVAACLASERFRANGLDAVVVDLTRTARTALSADWQRDFRTLLMALDAAHLPQRVAVVVLCEDGFAMRGAEVVLRTHSEESQSGRQRPLRQGALLMNAGILEVRDAPPLPELPAVAFMADVKDASLAPLRDRLMGLARRLREAGHATEARAVGSGLRALSTFASLPLGITEAKNNASVLFDGDGYEDVRTRSSFFPTSVLQPMAEIESTAPEFAGDIRQLLDSVKSHIGQWENATPISLKLAQLLRDSAWNAHDVLLVLPDTRTTDVFVVSDCGVGCLCTIIEVSGFLEAADRSSWRRCIVLRPEPRAVRTLLTTRGTLSHVLLLGDTAGMSLLAAELDQLISIPEFAPFSARATALRDALNRGGANGTVDLAEAEFHYRLRATEDLVDLTQAGDGYTGTIVRFHLEGGGRAAYRSGGDVLVFTPDEVRPFRRVSAREVRVGDSILVLRRDIRDKLSEALSRSRKTAAQLKLYHEKIVQFRKRLPGNTLKAKARDVLAAMRAIDPSIGEHEVPNIVRWLSVEPSDSPQQPRAARDQRRFLVFMEAAGIDKTVAGAFWELAIVPVRAYSAQEGHLFNRRVVQFVIDPEGVAAGAGWREYEGLWQAVIDSVDHVVEKELADA
jgi:hypothetical protein